MRGRREGVDILVSIPITKKRSDDQAKFEILKNKIPITKKRSDDQAKFEKVKNSMFT